MVVFAARSHTRFARRFFALPTVIAAGAAKRRARVMRPTCTYLPTTLPGSLARHLSRGSLFRLRAASPPPFAEAAVVPCHATHAAAARSSYLLGRWTSNLSWNRRPESFGVRASRGRATAITCRASKHFQSGGVNLLTPNPAVERLTARMRVAYRHW